MEVNHWQTESRSPSAVGCLGTFLRRKRREFPARSQAAASEVPITKRSAVRAQPTFLLPGLQESGTLPLSTLCRSDCMTPERTFATLFILSVLTGCHFQAGFGSKQKEQTATDRDRTENTVVNADGTSATTETVVETVSFDDGSSSTVSTTTRKSKDQSGQETSRSTSVTTTETSANGSTMSSTSSRSN